MPTPPPAIESQILGAVRQGQAVLIGELTRATVEGEALDSLKARVTRAVDGYSVTLLDDLIAAAQPLSVGDTAWVRDRYLELMLELATSACNVVRDPATRHAVAQSVQCTILQHEQHLRTVLDAALAGDR